MTRIPESNPNGCGEKLADDLSHGKLGEIKQVDDLNMDGNGAVHKEQEEDKDKEPALKYK
jgi:hypothetical protein